MRPALRSRVVYLAALGASLALSGAASAATVFTETFNRTNSSTIGNNWAESNPGGGGVSIVGQELSIFSDNTSDDGISYITQAMSNFSSPFTTILTSNPGLVTWTLNMRSGDSDLSGFTGNTEGIAFVLGATSSDMTAANGYAVVWGQSGSTDPIRLVRFSGGLDDTGSTITNLITATGVSGTGGDPNLNYMSVKVTYDPSTDTFELFTRSDGSSAFADPATGSYTSAGSLVNTTYTGSALSHIAALGAYGTDNQEMFFDNIRIDVVPEPATAGLAAVAALGITTRRRRRVV